MSAEEGAWFWCAGEGASRHGFRIRRALGGPLYAVSLLPDSPPSRIVDSNPEIGTPGTLPPAGRRACSVTEPRTCNVPDVRDARARIDEQSRGRQGHEGQKQRILNQILPLIVS